MPIKYRGENCKKDDHLPFLAGIFVGFVITLIVVLILDYSTELGQSICNEKGHGKFIEFNDGVLTCESKSIEEKYDGIKIRIQKR